MRNIAISVSCLSVCSYISNDIPTFTNFFVHVLFVAGSSSSNDNAARYVLPVYVYDILFSHNGAYVAESNSMLFRRVRQVATPVATSDVNDCLVNVYIENIDLELYSDLKVCEDGILLRVFRYTRMCIVCVCS